MYIDFGVAGILSWLLNMMYHNNLETLIEMFEPDNLIQYKILYSMKLFCQFLVFHKIHL